SLRHILPNFLSAGLHFLEYSFLTLQLLLTFLQVKYNHIQHLAPIHQSNKLHLVLHISEIFLNHYSVFSIRSEIEKKAPNWQLNNRISIFFTFFNCLNSLSRAQHSMESTLRHLSERLLPTHLML